MITYTNNDVSMNPPIDRDVKNNIIDFSLPFVIDVQTIRCVLLVAACEADVSFCFPGGEITQASELAGERRSAPGASKDWGEVPALAVSIPSCTFLVTHARKLFLIANKFAKS